MHWADTASWDALEYLLSQLSSERLFLVATLRSEEAAYGVVRERRRRLSRDERRARDRPRPPHRGRGARVAPGRAAPHRAGRRPARVRAPAHGGQSLPRHAAAAHDARGERLHLQRQRVGVDDPGGARAAGRHVGSRRPAVVAGAERRPARARHGRGDRAHLPARPAGRGGRRDDGQGARRDRQRPRDLGDRARARLRRRHLPVLPRAADGCGAALGESRATAPDPSARGRSPRRAHAAGGGSGGVALRPQRGRHAGVHLVPECGGARDLPLCARRGDRLPEARAGARHERGAARGGVRRARARGRAVGPVGRCRAVVRRHARVAHARRRVLALAARRSSGASRRA